MRAAQGADLAQVSLVSAEMCADPFDYFAALVDRAPVLWNQRHRAWLVSRYQDVVSAFRNDGIDADRIGPYMTSRVAPEDRRRFQHMFDILSRWLVFRSPPDHTRLRRLVHKSFTPRRVAMLRDKTRDVAARLAFDLRRRLVDEHGTVDLLADYCVPLPGLVIAEMFGVPPWDGPRLKHWAEELGLIINASLRDPDRNERVASALAEFEEYLRELIRGYRQSPADNVLSALVKVSDEEGALDELEIIATSMLILDAGYKTVQNAMANAMHTLMAHPEAYERAAADHELVPVAVEECLRYSGPGNVIVRRAGADLDFGGQQISRGSRIYLLTGAANRDPSCFDAPHEFRVDRQENPHVTFGQGIHYCLGAPLARMEMTAGIGTLLTSLPRLELAVESAQLEWHSSLILHGVNCLPVRVAG